MNAPGQYRARRNADGGSALFLCVGYLAVMMLISTVFLTGVHRELALHRMIEWTATSHALAEAGIHKAVAIHETNAQYHGETNTPLGQGRFTVRIEPGEADGTLLLYSTGEYLSGNDVLAATTVEATARITADRVTFTRWKEVGKW